MACSMESKIILLNCGNLYTAMSMHFLDDNSTRLSSTSFPLIGVLFLAEFILSATVTLDSIEIYKTHELLSFKPTVYFRCKQENKTVLPDVKQTHVLYTFKGKESWQPLTEFPSEKCKRCGIYEQDTFKSDDMFDEWELCPSDFVADDGKFRHTKEKEVNATFLCPECVALGRDSSNASGSHNGGKGMHWALVITIIVLVSTVFVLGAFAAYKYWQKRKMEHDQARFLKLFEDGDDIEDELGIGPLSSDI
ncbi:hypothetical protein RJ639_023571 [Escallonia herrerae]|uniref:DUF7953 domain-containing protein n=1 Tax=Escallonia herrerae TaxID=1293975 RepID=A0AA88V004_9ASTE|nr:hypothetical protein RJ639_023571 [Escallonia herrerae]